MESQLIDKLHTNYDIHALNTDPIYSGFPSDKSNKARDFHENVRSTSVAFCDFAPHNRENEVCVFPETSLSYQLSFQGYS
ncbi:unnamed protein product [Haemonchus placei]|uniref:Tyrosine-protein phosphatase domain-containing protein n=1 Tax=Haemonchus placei TaxID=6290 RepID=A0A0N4VYZ1_HAEPC|nr:unnamed protein product [Haemonchus placei]